MDEDKLHYFNGTNEIFSESKSGTFSGPKNIFF